MSPRIVAGRYELLDRLGSGGMATVWRARDRSLGRLVAVKVLHENLAQDALFVERFRREARNAAGLTHPNVVAVYDTGVQSEDGTQIPFIVMEYVEGPSLHQVLRSGGPLPVARAVRVGRQVLQALRHAHARGLVHRDVKPGNVLVADDAVKVADFGIAKGLEETMALTQTGTLVGTASYISPEQASGRPATAASDLYAVGCVLFESLTGHPPYVADNAVAVALAHQRSPIPSVRAERPDVPAALDAAIARALAKDPSRRFASAADMDAALGATGLDTAPDQAPTLVAAAPTERIPAGTEVLPTARPVPPNRLGRLFGWTAIVLLALALVWLGLTLLNLLGPDASPTPSPTPAPTLEPTPPPTRRPTPPPSESPSPSPEPTPEPTDLQPRTPRPPQTPNLPGFLDESPSPEPTG